MRRSTSCLDGRREAAAHARGADAERAALHAVRGPGARHARPPGPRLRPLRGHRPAGHRPRRHVVRRRGAVARRLRAQRGRGRRAGLRRGGRPPAARLHGQPRVPRRGVPRGRPARVPRLHQARLLARPRRTSGAALRRPRGHRRLASRRVRTPYRRPPPRPGAPRGTGRARRPRARRLPGDPGRRGGALHPDPGLLAAGAVGQPRGARSRRWRSPSTTSSPASTTGPRSWRVPAGGWSGRRAAGPRGTSGTSAG